jgi:hypothetical protein
MDLQQCPELHFSLTSRDEGRLILRVIAGDRGIINSENLWRKILVLFIHSITHVLRALYKR